MKVGGGLREISEAIVVRRESAEMARDSTETDSDLLLTQAVHCCHSRSPRHRDHMSTMYNTKPTQPLEIICGPFSGQLYPQHRLE